MDTLPPLPYPSTEQRQQNKGPGKGKKPAPRRVRSLQEPFPRVKEMSPREHRERDRQQAWQKEVREPDKASIVSACLPAPRPSAWQTEMFLVFVLASRNFAPLSSARQMPVGILTLPGECQLHSIRALAGASHLQVAALSSDNRGLAAAGDRGPAAEKAARKPRPSPALETSPSSWLQRTWKAHAPCIAYSWLELEGWYPGRQMKRGFIPCSNPDMESWPC